MQCAANTLEFHKYTAGRFLKWAEQRGITYPQEAQARHVREYLAELVGSGKSDNTVRDHARAIRILVIFWQVEGYMPEAVKFAMPKVAKKRLPCLAAEEGRQTLGNQQTYYMGEIFVKVRWYLRASLPSSAYGEGGQAGKRK
jgi:site-specific recombinase XerD